MINALVAKFESGIIACSLAKIANEIGGITHETIRNYFNKFEKYGLLRIENKGTHRQIIYLDLEAIKEII